MTIGSPDRATQPMKATDRYIIRRYVEIGSGYAVEKTSVRGHGAAPTAGGYRADNAIGTKVLDKRGTIVAKFGDVPASVQQEALDLPQLDQNVSGS